MKNEDDPGRRLEDRGIEIREEFSILRKKTLKLFLSRSVTSRSSTGKQRTKSLHLNLVCQCVYQCVYQCVSRCVWGCVWLLPRFV